MDTLTSPEHWAVVIASFAIVSLIIGLHYEVLRNCIRFLPSVTHRRRRRVVFLILMIMATHMIEIWIFGLSYDLLLDMDAFGSIRGQDTPLSLVDHVYFSAMIYTTVGFGDLVPTGPIRFMAGMEALTGLVMITWSASFTFLEMQRDWRIGRD